MPPTRTGGISLTIPYSSFRKGDGRKGHVGLYFYNHDPDLSVNGIFPLWFHRYSTDGFENKTQVLTFYDSRENEDRFQTLFPLYGYWSDPDGSRFLSWGVWRRRDADGTSGVVPALFFGRTRRRGDQNRIFFPLYWRFKRAPDWQVDVFFPFYTRYRDGDNSGHGGFPLPPAAFTRAPVPQPRLPLLAGPGERQRHHDAGARLLLAVRPARAYVLLPDPLDPPQPLVEGRHLPPIY